MSNADPLPSSSLLEEVSTFHTHSLQRRYYESFNVNSKNWMNKSAGTVAWIDACGALLDKCVAAVRHQGASDTLRQAFTMIFDLLEQIDDGDQDFVFFADEAGSWQVGVDWEQVLPAWFACLAVSVEPEIYATETLAKIDSFAAHARNKLLAKARRIASRKG